LNNVGLKIQKNIYSRFWSIGARMIDHMWHINFPLESVFQLLLLIGERKANINTKFGCGKYWKFLKYNALMIVAKM
jgi:hypothetical protein